MALIDDFVAYLQEQEYDPATLYAPILNHLVEFLKSRDLIISQRDAIYLVQQSYQRITGVPLSDRVRARIVSSVKSAMNKFKTDPENPIFPRDTTRFAHKGLTLTLRSRQPIARVQNLVFFEHDGLMANFEHFTARNAGWGFITNGGSPTGKTFLEVSRALTEFDATIYFYFDLDYYGLVSVINPFFVRTKATPPLDLDIDEFLQLEANDRPIVNLWNYILNDPLDAVLRAPFVDPPVTRPSSFARVRRAFEYMFPDLTPTQRLRFYTALTQGHTIKAVDYLIDLQSVLANLIGIRQQRILDLERVRELIRERTQPSGGVVQW